MSVYTVYSLSACSNSSLRLYIFNHEKLYSYIIHELCLVLYTFYPNPPPPLVPAENLYGYLIFYAHRDKGKCHPVELCFWTTGVICDTEE